MWEKIDVLMPGLVNSGIQTTNINQFNVPTDWRTLYRSAAVTRWLQTHHHSDKSVCTLRRIGASRCFFFLVAKTGCLQAMSCLRSAAWDKTGQLLINNNNIMPPATTWQRHNNKLGLLKTYLMFTGWCINNGICFI